MIRLCEGQQDSDTFDDQFLSHLVSKSHCVKLNLHLTDYSNAARGAWQSCRPYVTWKVFLSAHWKQFFTGGVGIGDLRLSFCKVQPQFHHVRCLVGRGRGRSFMQVGH